MPKVGGMPPPRGTRPRTHDLRNFALRAEGGVGSTDNVTSPPSLALQSADFESSRIAEILAAQLQEVQDLLVVHHERAQRFLDGLGAKHGQRDASGVRFENRRLVDKRMDRTWADAPEVEEIQEVGGQKVSVSPRQQPVLQAWQRIDEKNMPDMIPMDPPTPCKVMTPTAPAASLRFSKPLPRSGPSLSLSKVSNLSKMSEGHASKGRARTTTMGGGLFRNVEDLKDKVRQNCCRDPGDISDFYKETGVWQGIARNPIFEHVALTVIAINALWIGFDTEFNDQAVLSDADIGFQVVEHMFCAWFFVEWLIRFLALEVKRQGFKDGWFTFDTLLVFLTVSEVWIMTLFILLTGIEIDKNINPSILRLLRLARMTKMARIAKLLHACPELMILIKGALVASRSVFFTLCLLLIVVYIFGVAFVQLTSGTEVGNDYFRSVPASMTNLLLHGCFGEELPDVVKALGAESYSLGVLLVCFVMVASLTVMNMLVGVLVEAVSVVAAVEKEASVVEYVAAVLKEALAAMSVDANEITRGNFEDLLCLPDVVQTLQDVDVDVFGVMDNRDIIFNGCFYLKFEDLLHMILTLRGKNVATVKDIVELRKMMLSDLTDMTKCLTQVWQQDRKATRC